LFFQNKQSIPKIIHKVYIEHSMKLPTELSENIKIHKDSTFVGFYDPNFLEGTANKHCGQPATFGSIPKHPILKKNYRFN